MDSIPSDTYMIRMFDAFKLPRCYSIPLFKLVKKWNKEMGPEATISRLKSLKTLFLTSTISSCPTWIALHQDGTPKGPFRPLYKLSLVSHRFRVKTLNCLMVYSDYRSDKLTRKQWKKFSTSFEAVNPFDGKDPAEEIRRILPELERTSSYNMKSVRNAWYKTWYTDPYEWVSSPTKRATGYGSVGIMTCSGIFRPNVMPGYVRAAEADLHVDSHFSVLLGPMWYFSTKNEQVMYGEAIGGAMSFTTTPPDDMSWHPVVGQLSVIQERGMKARIVANPMRVHQMVLSRLGNTLFRVLRKVPWDCTFDQTKGHTFIQKALLDEKTVYCYDLSDATNRFPLEVQEFVFSSIVDEEFTSHMKLFRRLARARWTLPGSDINAVHAQFIRCTTGQPLGLYPSFPLFAFTHGLLIRSLERECRVKDTFRVLGDDVVITDKRVAQRYVEVMQDLGVPISIDKSIISREVGEFAGKIVSKDGTLPIAKWQRFTMRDPLSIFRWMGISGLDLVPPRFRESLRYWISLPEPVGLGLNPLGVPHDDRLIQDLDDIYLRRWYFPGKLAIDSFDKKERLRDILLTFKERLGSVFDPPLHRQMRMVSKDRLENELTVAHINSCISEWQWLPPSWADWFNSYLNQSTRQAYPKQDELKPGAAIHLLKFMGRLSKRAQQKNEHI